MGYFDISNLIDKFAFYLEYEKNVSPKTLENYMLWLNRFLEYIWDMPVTELKRMQILDYRISLNQKWLDIKTINYHIVAIRSFLKFCLKNDIDCMTPEKLELAKIPAREINYLSEEEVQNILLAPILNIQNNYIKLARDEAILNFLYGTWLRVSELISLEKGQIKLDSNQFSVIGKWSKIRAVFMTLQAREKLEYYLDVRKDSSKYLFVSLAGNSYGNKLSRNAIEELVRKYAKLAGVDKKVTPHTLRHSFATTLIKKWADIRAVQTLLWHASITTTQIYTHIDDQYLQKVHELLNNS